MERIVVSFESVLGFCLHLSLDNKCLLGVLCNFWGNIKSFSRFSKVVRHRKYESPHLNDGFLVFDHLLNFVAHFV
jgi:hypothetical protein